MVSYDSIIAKDGYLVNGETGEKIIWYECDPSKNTECQKAMCRSIVNNQDEGEVGFCSKTMNPAFRRDGGRAFYAVLKEDTYWGREYIDEQEVLR